jgi:acetylornithine deacetylase
MDVIRLLSDLVAVDSVNPSLVPGAAGEGAVAEVAAEALRAAGLDVVIEPVVEGRPNVVGVLEGREPGPTIMFCGHLDTVGVAEMEDPFDPRIEDGRLYGRGSQDMKGGVAAMIAAAAALKDTWTRGRLIVACVCDEEFESIGADALVKTWKADAAVVTEPTDLRMAVGHKGFAWLEVVTEGRAAHGSRPAEGRDAILRMGRVLPALEALDRELQSRVPVDMQGTASLHASIIAGGRELSVYPDRCELQLERRTVSGEDGKLVRAEIEAILTRLRAADASFAASSRLITARPPYRVSDDASIVTAMTSVLSARGLNATPTGMSFWTDAAILAGAGIPSVIFGPGGAGLHSVEEYVRVADVETCRDVLVDVALKMSSEAITRS